VIPDVLTNEDDLPLIASLLTGTQLQFICTLLLLWSFCGLCLESGINQGSQKHTVQWWSNTERSLCGCVTDNWSISILFLGPLWPRRPGEGVDLVCGEMQESQTPHLQISGFWIAVFLIWYCRSIIDISPVSVRVPQFLLNQKWLNLNCWCLHPGGLPEHLKGVELGSNTRCGLECETITEYRFNSSLSLGGDLSAWWGWRYCDMC